MVVSGGKWRNCARSKGRFCTGTYNLLNPPECGALRCYDRSNPPKTGMQPIGWRVRHLMDAGLVSNRRRRLGLAAPLVSRRASLRICRSPWPFLALSYLLSSGAAYGRTSCDLYSIGEDLIEFDWQGSAGWEMAGGCAVHAVKGDEVLVEGGHGCLAPAVPVMQLSEFVTPLISAGSPFLYNSDGYFDQRYIPPTAGVNAYNNAFFGVVTALEGRGPTFYQAYVTNLDGTPVGSCTWTAGSLTSWITQLIPASSAGSGTVSFNVAAGAIWPTIEAIPIRLSSTSF